MENAGVQKKQAEESANVFRTAWDPFWFMRQVLGLGGSEEAPSFDVEETDDTYVCKLKVKLMLPDQADIAHAKAELDDSELTLVVPKAAAATPEPSSPQKSTRGTTENDRGSAGRKPRRGGRNRARRG